MAGKKKTSKKRAPAKRGTKSKGKPYVKISSAKREKMYEAWCAEQTIRSVSRKCTVHHKTVARYRRIDKWDERFEKIKQDANAKVDKKITDDLAQIIGHYRNIRNAGLNNWLNTLKSQIKAGRVPVLPLELKELGMLERLIAFLEGKPDSRPDVPAPVTADSGSAEAIRELLGKLEGLGEKAGQALADRIADKLADKL